jgi:hypothetical protein
MRTTLAATLLVLGAGVGVTPAAAPPFKVTEDGDRIRIATDTLETSIKKTGYVSGVEGASLLDKKTGARDLGFGLDIVDWIMEPGSDEAYRDKLPGDLPYLFNNLYHGKRAKRCVEGPQICSKAKVLKPSVIYGKDFVAVKQDFTYTTAAPGKKAGSKWEQTLVFPAGKRYFISADKITAANAGDAMFLRIDMPGHIRHKGGDTFSEVYLSYHGKIAAKEFEKDFAPDDKFLYARDDKKLPKRVIRGYRIRDPKAGGGSGGNPRGVPSPEAGKEGPWLVGMTLDPAAVYEAWCHQRGYVCMIEEIGGRAVKAGESFGAAFVVGYFDSIEEAEKVYDEYAGSQGLDVNGKGWRLTRKP